MKLTTLLSAVTLLILSAGSAISQPPLPPEAPEPMVAPMGGSHWGMRGGPHWDDDARCEMGERYDDLKLSDDQRAKLDKMRLEHQTQMMDWHNEMAMAKTQLKKLIIADKADDKAIGEAAAKLGKLHEQKAKLMAAHLRQVRAILTDEQRVKFDSQVLSSKGMGMRGKKPGCGMGFMGRSW